MNWETNRNRAGRLDQNRAQLPAFRDCPHDWGVDSEETIIFTVSVEYAVSKCNTQPLHHAGLQTNLDQQETPPRSNSVSDSELLSH